jgi:uncharacterized protein (DUF433 family)
VDLTTLSRDQILQLELAFRYPRGRYGAERASQLSGVPRRTLHDWARVGVYRPDFDNTRPKMWSYRDLVFVRLFAWLRTKGMERGTVSARVGRFKTLLEEEQGAFSTIRSDGRAVLTDDALMDEWSGQRVFAEVASCLDVFDLRAPLDMAEFRKSKLWGPNLVKPSDWTAMSPWIMAGDPCIDKTRIPTIGLYALRQERGLDEEGIAALYSIERDAVSDALVLEERLHEAA